MNRTIKLKEFIILAKEIKEKYFNIIEKKEWENWKVEVLEIAKKVNWKDEEPHEVFKIFNMCDYIITDKVAFGNIVKEDNQWLGDFIISLGSYDAAKEIALAYFKRDDISAKTKATIGNFILHQEYLNNNNGKMDKDKLFELLEILLYYVTGSEEYEYLYSLSLSDGVGSKIKYKIIEDMIEKNIPNISCKVESDLEAYDTLFPLIGGLNGKIDIPKKELFEKIMKEHPKFKFQNIDKTFSKGYVYGYDLAYSLGVEAKIIEGDMAYYKFNNKPSERKESAQWFIKNNVDIEKARIQYSIAEAQLTQSETAIIWAKLSEAKVVSEYTKELVKELTDLGVILELVEDGINLKLKKEVGYRLLPVMKKSSHAFTKANIVIEDLNDFWIFFVRTYGDNNQILTLEEKIEAQEEEKYLKSVWDKANGVIEWIEKDSDIEKHPLKINQDLGDNYYLHTWGARAGIDDYVLFGVKTKGSRRKGNLNKFVEYRNKMGSFGTLKNLKDNKICWECGQSFNFFNFSDDLDNSPAWEAVARKIDMWEEEYCGC